MNRPATTQLKQALVTKLEEEGCYFGWKDVSIKAFGKDAVRIVIKDYEFIEFIISVIDDEFFHDIAIDIHYPDCEECDTCYTLIDGTSNPSWFRAMLNVGYYIGTRF